MICTALVLGGSAASANALESPTTLDPTERDYVLALESRMSDATADELAQLSPTDRALLTEYGRVVDVTEGYSVQQVDAADVRLGEINAPPAVTSCYTATSTRVATGIAGNTLYKSWHVGRWCKTGSTVTSASRVEQGWQTYWLGWNGKGLIGGSAAVVSNQGRS
jgi:hypothetical protein